MGYLRGAIAVATASMVCAACEHSTSSPTTPTDIATVIVAGTPPAAGTSSQFTAIAVHTGGASETVTSRATWRSSNNAIATVNANGVVTGLANGQVEISAVFANVRGFLAFDVRRLPN